VVTAKASRQGWALEQVALALKGQEALEQVALALKGLEALEQVLTVLQPQG
jgi:hypothetical protein